MYKTAFYSFYLPVALAMRMVGVTSQSSYDTALKILLPLGEYFQVQDDYLDCYGAPELIGKIGTDILDNKCSWNINVALGIATPAQRKVLDVRRAPSSVRANNAQECYGRRDSASEARVKAVYAELDLTTLFNTYEVESYAKINALIETIPEGGADGLKRDVFTSFLGKVYKRTK